MNSRGRCDGCGAQFRTGEDFRDHLPCPASEKPLDIVGLRKRFEATIEDLEKRIDGLNRELRGEIRDIHTRLQKLEALEPMLYDWNIFKRVERLESTTSHLGVRRNARPVRRIIEQDAPVIVCLCGSTRFSKAFADALLSETLAGKIVLTVGSMTHSDAELKISDEQKKALDALHLHKISMADEVLVLNAMRCIICGNAQRKDFDNWGHGNGCRYFRHTSPFPKREHGWEPYIGDSTKNEIRHALKLGKPIRYLNPNEPK